MALNHRNRPGADVLQLVISHGKVTPAPPPKALRPPRPLWDVISPPWTMCVCGQERVSCGEKSTQQTIGDETRTRT